MFVPLPRASRDSFFQVAYVVPDVAEAEEWFRQTMGVGYFERMDGVEFGATCEVRLEDDGRTAMSFRYGFTLPSGEVIHVRTGRKYAQAVNSLMRGENDAECTMDCHEGFSDFEVEETGDRGYGCAEYSVMPPTPHWRY